MLAPCKCPGDRRRSPAGTDLRRPAPRRAQADEYAAAASELAAGRRIAATSLAIHAVINAADAVSGARLDVRAAGEDHDQVIGLHRQARKDGSDIPGAEVSSGGGAGFGGA